MFYFLAGLTKGLLKYGESLNRIYQIVPTVRGSQNGRSKHFVKLFS